MSRKLTLFRSAFIAPQTTCNYIVHIPSIITSPFAVESATMPFAEVESKMIAIRGVQYSVPVKRKAQGQWSCTLNENILLTSIYQSLFKLYTDMTKNGRDADVGVENPVSTDDIHEVFSTRLRDIYIFITDGISGAVPMLMCVLKNCYLVKINPLPLEASGGANPMKIQLTFQYNDIVSGFDKKAYKNPAVIAAVNAAKLTAAYDKNKELSEILK